MIRFSFFNQGGRVRLDMVGAGGWIHASRLRFPSGSVANAARSLGWSAQRGGGGVLV